MDEPETRICPNCKREIPAVNFTIHTVHCARNIKVCPVCKEPVLVSELADHHEKMHKLLPCKKCGEQVCGTDLEDHIRDSCAHTIKACKFCELELPRRELPLHEGYCGVRTEQCPQCREWVMIKYRQLHLDSNHGFLRLNDDPPPPKKEVAKVTRPPKPSNIPVASTSPVPSDGFANGSIHSNGPPAGPSTSNGPRTTIVKFKNRDPDEREKKTEQTEERDEATLIWRQRALLETARQVKLPKRTNDQPQINTNTSDKPKNSTKKIMNKKRQAPPPPSPTRDLAYYSAEQRRQHEDQLRAETNACNLARGLPPVLSPAAKLERLRKMDRLLNWETEPGPSRPRNQSNNTPESFNPEELRNLKPMTTEQFERRFNALRLAPDSGTSCGASGSSSRTNGNSNGANGNSSGANGNDRLTSRNNLSASGRGDRDAFGDRFNEIKSSLRELRRGLNEVTAPYNLGPVNNEIDRHQWGQGARAGAEGDQEEVGSAEEEDVAVGGGGEQVQLPCEFCGRLQPLHDLVRHQTGCRPDLAQLKVDVASERRGRATQVRHTNSPQPEYDEPPVIPCEFCTESLPLYLISEHQERCRRDANPLYLD